MLHKVEQSQPKIYKDYEKEHFFVKEQIWPWFWIMSWLVSKMLVQVMGEEPWEYIGAKSDMWCGFLGQRFQVA